MPSRETTIQSAKIDADAFAEWVDGQENLITGEDRSQKATWIIWTDKTVPGHSGLRFGDTKMPGARHLRIGFKEPVAVGSVFVSGGGRLSVLKPGASYPGDLANEADWTEAERIVKGEVSSDEVDQHMFAVWTLPPGTQTCALRFSHTAEVSDGTYAGFLGSARVTGERWSNLAPQALTGASSRAQNSVRLNNGLSDRFKTWDNVGENDAALPDLPVVSPRDPAWVMLSWPRPVDLDAVNALDAGFQAAEVQSYTGPADRHPRDAAATDWQSLDTFTDLQPGYPVPLWCNPLDFGRRVTTRAIRLKITTPNTGGHPHILNMDKDGKRVWLGELMALQRLGDERLQPIKFPDSKDEPHPPIAVRFTLDEPGYVTLVIDDESGKRVRNLISETPFPAGENAAWWDGTDDLGRDVDAARHGVYKIPAQFVMPGSYRVRGLVRDEIVPRYEFSIYSGGHPAWETADKSGGWLTNHTPPQAALFIPAAQSPTGASMVYLGSAVSEGGAGLAWVDLNGKKIGGRGWIGGNWTASPFLARDAGAKAETETFAYVGATWTASANNKDRTHGELRITALTAKGDQAIIKHAFSPPPGGDGDHFWIDQLGGLAAHDGLIVASMNKLGFLLFVEAASGNVLAEVPLESPRGVAFDTQGRLLALSGAKLLRYGVNADNVTKLAAPQTLIATGLEDPHGLTVDATGRLFISDHGASHQVKVFSSDGKLERRIGKPGVPKAGLYDPLHMNHPAGLTIDANARIWVAENDYLPKRVSVWNGDGTLWKAFYGPAKYGGGGTLDPQDKTRFFYADEARGAMEFTLDWQKGESRLARIYYRPEAGSLPLPNRTAAPEVVLYREGRRYYTNCYNSNPTGGSTAMLFIERDGIARPVAGLGRAAAWDLLKTESFASRMPADADWKQKPPLFLWSDANDDAQVQPEEVTLHAAAIGGVTVMPDLSLCAARIGEKSMRFEPTGFSKGGAPLYDFAQGQTLAEGVQKPASSGGDQVLAGSDGWTPITLGIAPFARHSLSGAQHGAARWSYPSAWPGLHAAHEAPAPDRPGQLIGTTRLLGGFVTPRGSDAGQIWAVNANMGTVYLFTADGLFVATVFEDKRHGKAWSMPTTERNMSLKSLTIGEENFWPTWTQTPDGEVYVMNGAAASLIRLDGLESIRRLSVSSINVTAADLQKAQAWLIATEAQRQQAQGRGVLEIALRRQSPAIDGKLNDWAGAAWVDIDKSGVAAHFNSNSKPYDITGAIAVSGDRLFAAFRTNDEKFLQNSGEVSNAPFKTGGCLDVMLGVNPNADPKRTTPVEGDLRLLVTLVNGRPKAILYRAVVPGTQTPVPFSSPWRTITLDRVDDVSTEVQYAGVGGNYEFSIPLAALGFNPKPGQSLKGDIGILRGNGTATTARVYWSNKATGITSDVPSEAMLTPLLWGRVEITPVN